MEANVVGTYAYLLGSCEGCERPIQCRPYTTGAPGALVNTVGNVHCDCGTQTLLRGSVTLPRESDWERPQ